MGRSVEEGERLKGGGIFASLSNSDGDKADGLDAWNGICGVERLVDEYLSGLFEED